MLPENPAIAPHRRLWFDRGCEAFKSSFPTLVNQIPWERFYVCPLCRKAFSELTLTDAVDWSERLTDEDVPPKSVGGKKMLLTCGPCNWTSGSAIDSHMRAEADSIDFLKGNVREIQADLETGAGRVPIRLSMSNSSIKAVGVPKATRPGAREGVEGDFSKASVDGGWENFTFNIHLPEYSLTRASTSWLRSAYLAFFSVLGYRFILRREMDVVWERINNPELPEPAHFRILQPKELCPALVQVDAPEAFRSYAMIYGHNVVFLPRYNDRTLYERLAQHPDAHVAFTGKQLPWPIDGPMFLGDVKRIKCAHVQPAQRD